MDDIKCVYLEEFTTWFIVERCPYEEGDYNIISYASSELEAYRAAFTKVYVLADNCVGVLGGIATEVVGEHKYSGLKKGLELDVDSFESNPLHPVNNHETGECSKFSSLHYMKEHDDWCPSYR